MLVDGDERGFAFVACGEIHPSREQQKVAGLQCNATNLAFNGLTSALNANDNGVVTCPEIGLF